jgi:hypothetical protein
VPGFKAGVLGLSVLVIAGSPAIARAQIIGFKGGPTLSTLHAPDILFKTGDMLSFGAGLFIRFHLAGAFSIQPEALAVTKGAKVDRLADGDFELELKYVEVPLLIRASTQIGRFYPYVMAGPTVSFEYDCEVDVVDDLDRETSFDCGQVGPADVFERNTTDFGVTGVLGAEYAWGPGKVLLEARYTYGFTNIADEGSGGALDTVVKNRYGALFAGYAFYVHIF